MAFKPVSTVAQDIKKSVGVPHIGHFAGHSEIENKIGKQVIWNFTDQDELGFGIYGFTNLNRAMSAVPVGALCRIIYRGTENVKTKFGMKDVHQVEVAVDDGEDAPGGAVSATE